MKENLVNQLTIPDSVIKKWQRLIDALAHLMEVPTALIMKNEYPYLEAFITSRTEDNPITPDYKEKIFGTYCEITIKNKEKHEVHNALKHPIHKDKPALKENGLISYLGFPLVWPTGDIFGTICVLDRKERHFSKEKKDLMKELKISVDAHLELIYKNEQLKRAQERIKEQRDNLRLLTSTVRHDIANDLTYIQTFLAVKRKKSELPKDFDEKLLPYVKSSIKSIENIKKLEQLFTEEREFEQVRPRSILEEINNRLSKMVSITGSCSVQADEFLELALKELIRNAFKHTDTPKVEITLSENANSSRIKIQDYGGGLPQNVIESHFKEKNKKRELKGLTIVQKIMNRYNGDLIYEKNAKGSLFELIWYDETQD
jgi:K+-sensing histidine kinase KdpD